MLLDPDVFFAPSSVVDSSNYHHPFLFHLICLFFLKMGRKPYCPDGGKDKSKKKKKKDTDMDQTRNSQQADDGEGDRDGPTGWWCRERQNLYCRLVLVLFFKRNSRHAFN